MKISCIYIIKITAKINEFYIGSAVNFMNRKRIHKHQLLKNKHGNIRLQRIVNKYGFDILSFEIVERVFDTSKLIEREQFYLDLYQPSLNVCKIAGSTLGTKRSPEVCAKIKLINIGRKHTEQSRKNMSNAQMGIPKPISDSHRKKLSESHIGEVWTQERRDKLSKTNTGKKFPKEFGLKQSERQKGKKISDETKRRISEKLKGTRHSDESIKRGALKRTGMKFNVSETARQKLIERNKKERSQEYRDKISKSLTGKKQSPETIEKRKVKCIGMKRTPEQRKRMSDAMKGVKRSFETCNKLSEVAKMVWARRKLTA